MGRRFVLGDEEKEKFRMLMWMAENFSGYRVLSYCVLSNHFQVLLEVPPRVAAEGEYVLAYESEEEALPPQAVAAGAERGGKVPGVAIEESDFFRRLQELYCKRLKRGLLDGVQAATLFAVLAGWVARACGVSCGADAGPCSMIAFIVLAR